MKPKTKLEIDFSFHKKIIFYENSISNQWRKEAYSINGIAQNDKFIDKK